MNSLRYHQIIAVVFIFLLSEYASCLEFGYQPHDGPDTWRDQFPLCAGYLQSPINIRSMDAKKSIFPPISITQESDKLTNATITNEGHSVIISIDDIESRPTISAGPMWNDHYKLAKIHFHWGEVDSVGSETQINGKPYPLEMHLVFYNKKYKSFEAATDGLHKDGLVVLGVLFKLSPVNNMVFNFTNKFDNISYPGEAFFYHFNDKSFRNLLPQNINSYYTYKGSLTTPPCKEIATWIVFTGFLPISHKQLESFRSLHDVQGKFLNRNFREIQKTNGRAVYINTNRR